MGDYISFAPVISIIASFKMSDSIAHYYLHRIRNLLPILSIVLLSLGILNPIQAQGSTITCTSTQISPQLTDNWINSNSIDGSEDGQIVYLMSDRESSTSTLYLVKSDDTFGEVGQIADATGFFGAPRWNVDTSSGDVVYTSYIEEDYSKPTSIILMDLTNGEQSVLMGGVNESDFGREDGLIWWSSNQVDDPSSDYGLYLYDPSTKTKIAFEVSTLTTDSKAFTARLIRIQPNGDVLFSVSREIADTDSTRISYYQGDPQVGISQLFHEEELDNNQFSYSDVTTVLDDRIAYIDAMGEYKEIDFEGNILNSISLLGAGIYRDLKPTQSGMLFTYVKPDNTGIQSLYHVSKSGIISHLTSDEGLLPQPSNVIVIPLSDGSSKVWFNTRNPTDYNKGTLYLYTLPADDTIAVDTPTLVINDLSDFYNSPTGSFIVASIKRSAVLIDTRSLQQIDTETDYYANAVFFDGDEGYIFDQGHLQFVDTAQNIAYYSTEIPPEDNFVLYASRYDGSHAVQVSLPTVNVPFDLHAYSFYLMPDGSVVYIGDNWQSLYRARCQGKD